jgi:hypothetical protein
MGLPTSLVYWWRWLRQVRSECIWMSVTFLKCPSNSLSWCPAPTFPKVISEIAYCFYYDFRIFSWKTVTKIWTWLFIWWFMYHWINVVIKAGGKAAGANELGTGMGQPFFLMEISRVNWTFSFWSLIRDIFWDSYIRVLATKIGDVWSP